MDNQKSTLVFVYGTLMNGHGNHMLLRNAEFKGIAATKERFLMSASFIPYVSDKWDDIHNEYTAQIKGEIYVVSEGELMSLDALEGHPQFYCRKETDVWYYNEDNEPELIQAWLYFCNEVASQVIPTGSYNDYLTARSRLQNKYPINV